MEDSLFYPVSIKA